MYKLCRHVKTDGHRCQAAALRDSAYCYYHAKVHKIAHSKSTLWDDIYFPVFEDRASIQIALSQVANALLCSRIDARRAGLGWQRSAAPSTVRLSAISSQLEHEHAHIHGHHHTHEEEHHHE